MRYFVLGCNGMAGHTISLYLKEKGNEVLGFARNKSVLVDSVAGNANDQSLLRELIGINKFDAVINCIGVLNKAADDHKADAVYLNSYLPHYLADITEGTVTQVIHLSTDCVFSGKKGQYSENDLRDGTSFYDRSKALGELNNNKDLTLRQSIIGPDLKSNGIGLLNWFLQQHDEVIGYTRAIWTGQTTLQLAKTIEAASKEKVHGLYNMVPDASISKCDLLQLFNEYLRTEKINIIPDDTISVDKSLKRTAWDFNYTIPLYEQMIIELSQWMREHKTLYPHYCL